MGPGIYHMRLNYKDQACEKDWTWERDCSEVKRNYPVGDMCKGKDAGCQWEWTTMLSSVWNQQRQKGVKGKDSPKWMEYPKVLLNPTPSKKTTTNCLCHSAFAKLYIQFSAFAVMTKQAQSVLSFTSNSQLSSIHLQPASLGLHSTLPSLAIYSPSSYLDKILLVRWRGKLPCYDEWCKVWFQKVCSLIVQDTPVSGQPRKLLSTCVSLQQTGRIAFGLSQGIVPTAHICWACFT